VSVTAAAATANPVTAEPSFSASTSQARANATEF